MFLRKTSFQGRTKEHRFGTFMELQVASLQKAQVASNTAFQKNLWNFFKVLYKKQCFAQSVSSHKTHFLAGQNSSTVKP